MLQGVAGCCRVLQGLGPTCCLVCVCCSEFSCRVTCLVTCVCGNTCVCGTRCTWHSATPPQQFVPIESRNEWHVGEHVLSAADQFVYRIFLTVRC